MKYSELTPNPTPTPESDGNEPPPLPNINLNLSKGVSKETQNCDCNIVSSYKHQEEEKPTPEKNKDVQEFFINYDNKKEIFKNKEFSLLLCYNKIQEKKFIVKDYSEDFINQINQFNNNYLFDIEKDHFKNFDSKYIL